MWRGIRTQETCRMNPRCQMWRSVSHSKALNFSFSFIKRQSERKKLHSHPPKCCHAHPYVCTYTAAFLVNTKGCNSTVRREPYRIYEENRTKFTWIMEYIFMDPVAEGSFLFFLDFSILQKIFLLLSLSILKSPLTLGKLFPLLIPTGIVPVCCRFSAGCPGFSPDHHKLLFWMCLSTCRSTPPGYHSLPTGKTQWSSWPSGSSMHRRFKVIPLIWGYRPLPSAGGQSAGKTVKGASWMQSSHMNITSQW